MRGRPWDESMDEAIRRVRAAWGRVLLDFAEVLRELGQRLVDEDPDA